MFDLGLISTRLDKVTSAQHDLVSSNALPATDPTLSNAAVDTVPVLEVVPTASVTTVMHSTGAHNSLSSSTRASSSFHAAYAAPSELPSMTVFYGGRAPSSCVPAPVVSPVASAAGTAKLANSETNITHGPVPLTNHIANSSNLPRPFYYQKPPALSPTLVSSGHDPSSSHS